MKEDLKPKKLWPYTYNDTFAKKIKKEIDKILEANFICEIEHIEWVSPKVVVPKTNEKLWVCVNLKQANVAAIRNNYPPPIANHVIERVVGKKEYSFYMGFQDTIKSL